MLAAAVPVRAGQVAFPPAPAVTRSGWGWSTGASPRCRLPARRVEALMAVQLSASDGGGCQECAGAPGCSVGCVEAAADGDRLGGGGEVDVGFRQTYPRQSTGGCLPTVHMPGWERSRRPCSRWDGVSCHSWPQSGFRHRMSLGEPVWVDLVPRSVSRDVLLYAEAVLPTV
ncbi:conserved hypothetical protein [Streptomyces lividans TK24]|nr:conserved hypothetical protein [Streptomyces lividans TK24]